jgi:hypothetical protein
MAGGSYYYFEMKKPTNATTDEPYLNPSSGKDLKQMTQIQMKTHSIINENNDSVYQ